MWRRALAIHSTALLLSLIGQVHSTPLQFAVFIEDAHEQQASLNGLQSVQICEKEIVWNTFHPSDLAGIGEILIHFDAFIILFTDCGRVDELIGLIHSQCANPLIIQSTTCHSHSAFLVQPTRFLDTLNTLIADKVCPTLVQNKTLTRRSTKWQSPLNGFHLKIATLPSPPTVIFERNPQGVVSYKGFCFEIINTLQQIFNFTYSVHYPADNAFGIQKADGTWSGIIGMLINQEVDLGASDFSVTLARVQVVDFSTAILEDSTAILIPPPAEDSKLFACFRPFQLLVWTVLLLAMATLPVILWLLYQPLQNAMQPAPSNLSLFRQYYFVFAVLVSQSGQPAPSVGHGPRLLAAVWSLCAVVFIYVYVGTLVSFLSVPKLRPIIESLQDLESAPIEWGVRRGSITQTLFTEAKEGLFHSLRNQLIDRPTALTDTDAEGVDRVINGSYAFINIKSFFDFAIEKDLVESGRCRLHLVKNDFNKAALAFPMAKGSNLTALFNPKIQRMIETGLADYWHRKYWPRRNRCTDTNDRSRAIKSLSLSDLQSVFLVLAVGIALAVATFLVELLVYKMQRPST